MPDGLDVRVYAADQLYEALSNARFSAKTAEQHIQARYIDEYLTALGVKTMVVEHEYVDGDYLADFSSFYVSCFEEYHRFCKRLHFFALEFGATHFERILFGKGEPNDVEVLRDAYRGFVVVRPLPIAVVGRTALATYPRIKDKGSRNYTAVMPYRATLFGLRLDVTSLAFQEQDTVVAACATVSIWSALQKTASLFGTRAPRPPEITRDATRSFIHQRALPTSGLNLHQMLAAIRDAGLEPEVYEPITGNIYRPVASLVYAYSKAQLPVIVVADIVDIGLHAVTITGFSLMDDRVTPREFPAAKEVKDGGGNVISVPIPELLPLIGRRIDEFYAHDDGVGPFSRFHVVRPVPSVANPEDIAWHTHFTSEEWNRIANRVAPFRPIAFIIPVYHKIRLRYDDALAWITRVHRVMLHCVGAQNDADIEWDVHLTQTNDYKGDVANLNVSERRKFALLTASQPRFIWRATFRHKGVSVAEFLLDATSFSKAFPVFTINWFDASASDLARNVIGTGQLTNQLTSQLEQLMLAEINQRESEVIGLAWV